MKDQYFVLYARDRYGEKNCSQLAEGRQMYDRYSSFRTMDEAIEFAMENLGQQPVLAKSGVSLDIAERVRDPTKPYVVAAYYTGKYHHYCYDGSVDDIPTHEVLRCGAGELEKVLDMMYEESPDKLYVGVELTLFQDMKK